MESSACSARTWNLPSKPCARDQPASNDNDDYRLGDPRDRPGRVQVTPGHEAAAQSRVEQRREEVQGKHRLRGNVSRKTRRQGCQLLASWAVPAWAGPTPERL